MEIEMLYKIVACVGAFAIGVYVGVRIATSEVESKAPTQLADTVELRLELNLPPDDGKLREIVQKHVLKELRARMARAEYFLEDVGHAAEPQQGFGG